MIQREILKELAQLAKQYPIVTVTGPRQAGKTTLVKSAFPNKPYLSLEDPDIRTFAELDSRGFLNQYPDGAIFDEIQRLPKLLSYLQTIVDKNQTAGQFILTGSHQLQLHHAITQSLAGRTALLKLLPLSLRELASAGFNLSLNEHLLNGGYPRIYNNKLEPTKNYSNYFQTYVERDVRQLIHIKDLSLFQRFIKLCASRIGQILNIHSFSNDLGISSHTVNNWLSILEASFLIFRLQPYFENFGKRIIKSPKLYFTDVGFATYLLDIETVQQVNRDPLRGYLIENLVILELVKARLNQGNEAKFYYYRDNHQHEVDVIYKSGHELIPIEIKGAQTMHPEFLKGLKYFKTLVNERCQIGYVIYTGESEQTIGEYKLLNYKNSTAILEKNIS